MSEYSVYFNPPGFDDYPRTVQQTVDHVALNAHVERVDVNDVYVKGSSVPSSSDNDKIWIHYPDSQISPAEEPNIIAIPPPPTEGFYFPNNPPVIGAFKVVPVYSFGVFYDAATKYTWSLPMGGAFDQIRVYDSLGNIIYTSSLSTSFGYGQRECRMTKTPAGRLFISIAELINTAGDFTVSVLEVVGPTLSGSSFVYQGGVFISGSESVSALGNRGLCYDSSGSLYVVLQKYFSSSADPITEIYKSSNTVGDPFTKITTTLPSPYSTDFLDSQVRVAITNSANNILIMVDRPSGGGVVDILSLVPSTGVATLLTSYTIVGPAYEVGTSSIGIDSSDSLYFCMDNRVYKLTSGGTLTVYAGTGVAGNVDGPLLNAQFKKPIGCFVSGTELLVVDFGTTVNFPASECLIKSTAAYAKYPLITNSSFSYIRLIPYNSNSVQIIATNNPSLYGASGLPFGVSVNTSTGIISGVPTIPGFYTVTLTASNFYGGYSKEFIFEVLTPKRTNFFNLPALRKYADSTNAWQEISTLKRGDIILAPDDLDIVFPWGESNKVYDMTPWGEPFFLVPTLPTPPSGFKYKYYIGVAVTPQ